MKFIKMLAAALLLAVALPSLADSVVLGSTTGVMGDGQVAPLRVDSGGNLTLSTASTAFKVQVSTARPANTTTYAIGDVVGGTPTAVITFPAIGAVGANVYVTSVDLRIDIAAVSSGMTSFRLYLYNVTPPSALADNAAWDLPAGDRAGFVGYIDLGTPVDLGSTLYVQTDQVYRQLKLDPAGTALYGYLVTNGAIVPAAVSEVYTVTLRGVTL